MQLSLKEYFSQEFQDIKVSLHSLQELEKSVMFMSAKFDEMRQECETNKAALKQLTSENLGLKTTVSDLSTRLNLLEQYARQDNVEINGLPENSGENLISTVVQLGKVVSCNIQEQDIMSITRIKKLDLDSKRPRSVVVKLRNTRIRDEVLASVVKFNKSAEKDKKLNSSLLGYGGAKTPVFVSEHLSPMNKAIHAETRKVAREKGYKYVWVRDGRILVRKEDGARPKQIKNLQAIALL
ncbi:hypothetical protein PYW08_012605 [Mythimna loreyi]|uniref:Uncharacterized protein n=1 Tax=Mythimna loreyi TaxID=667449 RepID=A0ACC2Q326_9NEOP|nr:hypothetical protein PYW08_012605 [Mythimna loreyi]